MLRSAFVIASAVIALPGAQFRTTLHVYTPWAGSLPARAVVIDRTLRGACSHGSEVLTRADAWHCGTGNGNGRAYDPCFSNDRGGIGAHVLCTTSPWQHAVSLELTKSLPLRLANPQGDPKRFAPWAMVTSARQECELLRGTTGKVAGLRINYACAGSGVLLDLPKRGPTWTQPYASSFGSKTYRRVALRQVWW